MAFLIYRNADGTVSELMLKDGVNRLGRSEMNDIRVPEPSVSGLHCELLVEGNQIHVRDLGSTNGTCINQSPIQEAYLNPGQVLRVGHVDLVFRRDGEPFPDIPIPQKRLEAVNPKPELQGAACKFHGQVPARWVCTRCAEAFCDKCIVDGRKFMVAGVKFCPSCSSRANSLQAELDGQKKAQKTFGGEMAAAWIYPFRGEGKIIIFAGTIFFMIAAFAQRFLLFLALMVFVFTTGYLMAYAQKVVASSALGEDELPGWPDFSDYYQDIVIPFFQGAALFLLYYLPLIYYLVKVASNGLWTDIIFWILLLGPLFFIPMAWLAISMFETVMALSPHFVIPSILKIPGHYIMVVLQLIAVLTLKLGLDWMLNQMKISFLPWLIHSFFYLYFLIVMCRMIGIMYYLNRRELKWFKELP